MGTSSPSLGLPASRRLRQGRDFLQAKTHGVRHASGCLVANWLAQPAHPASRVGVITTRKLGGAVSRARARRLLREAFRLNQHRLAQPVDLVLIARPSIVGKAFVQVQKDLVQALRKTGLLKAE